MHHLAIMNPRWGLLPKILSGEKTIESRWYKNKSAPWNKIKAGDTVYFKDSGKPVTLSAIVSQVLQFDHPSSPEIKEIIRKYGQKITANNLDLNDFYQSVKAKNYVILIFLSSIQSIPPFTINKSGFGSMAAWICIENINQIKVRK